MPTDLAIHIRNVAAVDTHEHLGKESWWVNESPRDVLAALIHNYAPADLESAGLDAAALKKISDDRDPDLEKRWELLRPFWEAIQFTGYGEACRLLAREFFGLAEITPAALRAAQSKLDALRQPGQRLYLLREVAKLDHIQTDDFTWVCLPDASGPEFFFYDLGWCSLSCGNVPLADFARDLRVEVHNLATLRHGIETAFEEFGPVAIAVKSQHAYGRTLRWEPRSDADAERALETILRVGFERADEATRLCLGDWCLGQAAALAPRYHLPVKLHTGYYAGVNSMVVDRIRPGQLDLLLRAYPQTKFVLMHTAYPFTEELLAVVKHFTNAYADLCWAWAINPFETQRFVRSFLRAAPANKLFGFGGDTFSPLSAVAYSRQMRRWLTRTLQAEVDDGLLSEREAIGLATRFLRENQLAVFDLESKRAAVRRALAAGSPTV